MPDNRPSAPSDWYTSLCRFGPRQNSSSVQSESNQLLWLLDPVYKGQQNSGLFQLEEPRQDNFPNTRGWHPLGLQRPWLSNAEDGGDANYSGVFVPKIKVANTATRAGRRKKKKMEKERLEWSVEIDGDHPQPTSLVVLCMVPIDIYSSARRSAVRLRRREIGLDQRRKKQTWKLSTLRPLHDCGWASILSRSARVICACEGGTKAR